MQIIYFGGNRVGGPSHRPAIGNDSSLICSLFNSFIDEHESSKKQKEECRLGKEGHVSVSPFINDGGGQHHTNTKSTIIL